MTDVGVGSGALLGRFCFVMCLNPAPFDLAVAEDLSAFTNRERGAGNAAFIHRIRVTPEVHRQQEWAVDGDRIRAAPERPERYSSRM